MINENSFIVIKHALLCLTLTDFHLINLLSLKVNMLINLIEFV